MSDLRPFGRSGLRLSPLSLGGNVFGWSAGEEASFEVLDAYVAAGGNVIDSANIYSAWVPGNAGGESETIVGRWIAARGRHDDVVVVTKIGMAGGEQPKGLTRDLIRKGAEDSLGRLGIDRIDLFYAHEDDEGTDLAETMGAFDELVREGLVDGRGGLELHRPSASPRPWPSASARASCGSRGSSRPTTCSSAASSRTERSRSAVRRSSAWRPTSRWPGAS